jgi:hypothetical protein
MKLILLNMSFSIIPFQNGTTKYNDIIGKCIHRSNDTTMCSFMIEFIKKLKTGMYMREKMNAVLEHLGVLQVKIFIDLF